MIARINRLNPCLLQSKQKINVIFRPTTPLKFLKWHLTLCRYSFFFYRKILINSIVIGASIWQCSYTTQKYRPESKTKKCFNCLSANSSDDPFLSFYRLFVQFFYVSETAYSVIPSFVLSLSVNLRPSSISDEMLRERDETGRPKNIDCVVT